jgi:HD-GYP domain-containing protein (c-di-GMP phosphodiesterase class II)
MKRGCDSDGNAEPKTRCESCAGGGCGILDLVEALTAVLDAKSSYTKGHSDRVADLSSAIALSLGMSEDEAAAIHIGGHLHDIGKIGVPDSIIEKVGALTKLEYAPLPGGNVCG